ncbi:MAG: 3-phosphoshikimate 1-carboxyvinyltransferase [Desulforegulaceae bacterium]|nr:3-phosphoshikimate 1-carboxyvinyltransferase [Desulforegulaceae bacterium]
MKIVKPLNIKESAEVFVPGSKSYTHRTLIASALSTGVCQVLRPLQSEDTLFTMEALKSMGIEIERSEDKMIVFGQKGSFSPLNKEIYLGNSGTSMRLLTGVFALSKKPVILTGNKRMQERPINPLLDSLEMLGVKAESVGKTGCPPVFLGGNLEKGGKTDLDCRISSQFLSGLLMAAPLTLKGIEINLLYEPVSKPYIDMTLNIMKDFGIKAEHENYMKFYVPGKQKYNSGIYEVEPDCSNASYFFALAAVKKAKIKVKGVSFSSSQGDIVFAKLLEKMGCIVKEEKDGIFVEGKELKGIDADMKDMPDVAPTLAVVASFAKGETRIRNVAHLREKECDRIGCVVKELNNLGIKALEKEDGMVISGGKHKYGCVKTYDDHRMAMSFAVAGVGSKNGLEIEEENCVKKSFPNFWEVFEGVLEK